MPSEARMTIEGSRRGRSLGSGWFRREMACRPDAGRICIGYVFDMHVVRMGWEVCSWSGWWFFGSEVGRVCGFGGGFGLGDGWGYEDHWDLPGCLKRPA